MFQADELERLVGPERAERARTDPDNVDFLVWNTFATLETHRDEAWLAYRLQALGGTQVTAPARMAFWTGASREPLLVPSNGYIAQIRERARTHGGSDAKLAEFLSPIEVPVRVETPDVLCLVDATTGGALRGRGHRDRVVELIDSGLDHARRLDKALAVAVVYRAGTPAAAEVSRRMRELREPTLLARAIPHRHAIPPVALREVSWQQLLRMWQTERAYLRLDGLPVRRFLDHCRERGLL